MSVSHRGEPGVRAAGAARALTLSGALLVVGFVVNGIQRGLLHPAGAEDDHKAIFTEYAESDVWVATHLRSSCSCSRRLQGSSCSPVR